MPTCPQVGPFVSTSQQRYSISVVLRVLKPTEALPELTFPRLR